MLRLAGRLAKWHFQSLVYQIANLMADRNCPATKWWHLAKSLCGLGNSGSPTVAPLLNESQSTVFDDRAKADLLND